MYEVRTIAPPTAAAVDGLISLAEAKAHLRVDGDEDSALISASLAAAIDMIERQTSQVLTERTMEFVMNGWHALEIPREPVTGIVSITYATGNAEVVLEATAYRWAAHTPSRVYALTPWSRGCGDHVRVRFTAGYSPNAAPPSLIAAVKLMLGHLYANREAAVVGTITSELPFAIEALCRPYRRITI